MSVPIELHDKLVGVVNVSDKKSSRNYLFSNIDLKILQTIVHQAAMAIENASFHRKLEYLSISDLCKSPVIKISGTSLINKGSDCLSGI